MKKILFNIIILNFSFLLSFSQGGQRPGGMSGLDPNNMPKDGVISGVVYDKQINK